MIVPLLFITPRDHLGRKQENGMETVAANSFAKIKIAFIPLPSPFLPSIRENRHHHHVSPSPSPSPLALFRTYRCLPSYKSGRKRSFSNSATWEGREGGKEGKSNALCASLVENLVLPDYRDSVLSPSPSPPPPPSSVWPRYPRRGGKSQAFRVFSKGSFEHRPATPIGFS